MHSKEFSVNQGKHQNLTISFYVPYKFELILTRIDNSKNLRFSKSPVLKKFSQNFLRLVLGLVGFIDAKGIDEAQPTWP